MESTKNSSSIQSKEISARKKAWPSILIHLHASFESPFIWLTLNMVVISGIIWPGEPIHTEEVAFLFGLCFIIGAFSKLFTGFLADKYSRIKLMGVTLMGSSLCFFLYGFMPIGLGIITFNYIILITVLRELFTGTETVIPSFLDDAIEEEKRSEIFGLLMLVYQLVFIFASLISSYFFKFIWKEYFFIIGIVGILIGIVILVKGKEPKRGSERNELKSLLKYKEIEYQYNLNKETIKSTVFSKTNLIILIEGVFTQIVLMVPYILLIGYLESPPYNFSPIIFAFLGIFFGAPGMIIGSTIFSKRIDKSAEKNIKNRIYFIFISLIISYLIWLSVILIPYSELTPTEGENFLLVISHPGNLLSGILYLFGYLFAAVFAVCQRPLIQKLNLPEAQGAISSINSFFEILSVGIGAIIAGTLLSTFNNNYQMTVIFLMIIGTSGAFLWLYTLKTIDGDIKRVSDILNQRSEEIGKENS